MTDRTYILTVYWRDKIIFVGVYDTFSEAQNRAVESYGANLNYVKTSLNVVSYRIKGKPKMRAEISIGKGKYEQS